MAAKNTFPSYFHWCGRQADRQAPLCYKSYQQRAALMKEQKQSLIFDYTVAHCNVLCW